MMGIFCLMPPATPFGVIILLGTLIFYWNDCRTDKTHQEKLKKESLERGKSLKEKHDRYSKKLKTNPSFAKDEFFKNFGKFSDDGNIQKREETLSSIKNKILIPVEWDESIYSSQEVGWKTVFQGYDSEKNLIATRSTRKEDLGTFINSEDVPESFGSIFYSHELVTLNDGREVSINRTRKTERILGRLDFGQDRYESSEDVYFSFAKSNAQKVVVDCPKCSQKLRVPKRIVKVTCSSCKYIWTHNGAG